jgi:meiosis-specific protein
MKVSISTICLSVPLTSTTSPGFIWLDSGEGSNPPRATRSKAVKKSAPRRKTTQKQHYAFIKQIRKEQTYKDYFDPDSEVEKRLLGLDDLVRSDSISALLMTMAPTRGILTIKRLPFPLQKPKKQSHGKVVRDENEMMYAFSQLSVYIDTYSLVIGTRPPKEISQEIPHPSFSQEALLLPYLPDSQDSQTQQETQLLDTETQLPTQAQKRHTVDEETRPVKKVKISIGPAVDLGD